jgi:putative colanic acid biosynthesis UDP-glucose lipid carrier transferase
MIGASDSVSSKLQRLLDIAVIEGLLFLFAYLRGIEDFTLYYYPAAITPVLMWFIYSNSGVYRRFSDNISRALNVLWAWTKVIGILIVWAFVTKVSEEFSRQVIISWFAAGAFTQMLVHIYANYFVRSYMAKHRETITSVLVGNSPLGNYLAEHINSNPWIASKIIGVICDSAKDDEWHMKDLPHLGHLTHLRHLVEKHQVRRVYFVLPMRTSYQIRDMQLQLLDLNVDIVWAPDISGLHMISPSVKEVGGVPLYYLSESPLVEGARLSKLLLDKTLSMIALILFAPILIAAAIAVKASSPGPVLFRQERHGLDGKIIQVLKFRTMKVHQEAAGQVTQATVDDARVTTVGAFIRKTSIDELPQLFNVLKGDMSLVGPRPHAKAHNEFYSSKIQAYMSRHRILPGMTGLAQVNGFRGETDTLEKMEKRVEFDLAYINSWSIWLDIRIMIKTVITLFSKNVY